MRQWKTATKALTQTQIMNKFNDADTNGDGVLGLREFTKFLRFGMKLKLSDDDIETLLDKFDHDKDGTLDLTEFSEFMDEELAKFNAASETIRSNKAPPPPKKKLVYHPMTRTTRGHRLADSAAPPEYDAHPPAYDEGQPDDHAEDEGGAVRASLNDLPSSREGVEGGDSLHHTTPGKLQGNATISYTTRPKSAAGTSKAHRGTATSQRKLLPQATHDRGGRIGDPIGQSGKEKVNAKSMVNSFRSTGTTLAGTATTEVAPGSMQDTLATTKSTDSVLWVNEILQKQADIENKLGHSYF